MNRARAELEQALRGSDLIILVTALEDAADAQCAVRIAHSAQNGGALTFAFVIKSNADAQVDKEACAHPTRKSGDKQAGA